MLSCLIDAFSVVEFGYWVNINFNSSFLMADATQRGVQPDQIIFTDVAMKNEHIKRSALADLFLDT